MISIGTLIYIGVIAASAIAVPVIVYFVGFTPAGVTACRFIRFH